MVKINGEMVEAAGLTVGEYLDRNGYDRNRIVAELNLEILKNNELDERTLQENDSLEVLRFVGGG